MSIESPLSLSSQSSAFHPLHHVTTPQSYSSAYLDALSAFFEYFDHIFGEYVSDITSEEKTKKQEEFQNRFQIWSDKIIDNQTQNEIVTPSKQDTLIRAVKDLFHYSFLKPENLDKKKTYPLNPKDKQIETCLNGLSLSQSSSTIRQSSGISENQLLSLPNEVLSIIFTSSVTNWQSVGQLALTCKTFYQILQNPNYLHSLFASSSFLFPSICNPKIGHKLFVQTQFHPSHFGFAHTNLNDNDLDALAKQSSHLQSLTLTGGQFSAEKLAHLLKNSPQLQSLEFRQCNALYFDNYMAVVSLYATQLENLKIIDCNMHDRGLLALTLRAPQLRSFEYESSKGDRSLSDYGFISFFNCASQLESIKITGCLKVTQVPLITAYIDKQLQSSDNTLQYQGSQLKHLRFSYCSVMDQTLFNAIARRCPNLIKLELGFSKTQCMDNLSAKKRGLNNIINSCPYLNLFRLTDCSYFDYLSINGPLIDIFHN